MEEIQLTDRSDQQVAQGLLGRFDAPAFARRALQVETACADLLNRCRQERDQLLEMVRLRLGTLHALAGDWMRLCPFLASDGDMEILLRQFHDLKPRLRIPMTPTRNEKVLRRNLQEYLDCLERFNRRWQTHLANLDLEPVNRLRAEYNRWYLLEKECALGSYRLARTFFVPLDPWTTNHLLAEVPPMEVPILR